MNIKESLTEAVDLGLLSPEQVQPMLRKYSPAQIQEILENIISTQMPSGMQCSGNNCSI